MQSVSTEDPSCVLPAGPPVGTLHSDSVASSSVAPATGVLELESKDFSSSGDIMVFETPESLSALRHIRDDTSTKARTSYCSSLFNEDGLEQQVSTSSNSMDQPSFTLPVPFTMPDNGVFGSPHTLMPSSSTCAMSSKHVTDDVQDPLGPSCSQRFQTTEDIEDLISFHTSPTDDVTSVHFVPVETQTSGSKTLIPLPFSGRSVSILKSSKTLSKK